MFLTDFITKKRAPNLKMMKLLSAVTDFVGISMIFTDFTMKKEREI